jgi:hypothetical protein
MKWGSPPLGYVTLASYLRVFPARRSSSIFRYIHEVSTMLWFLSVSHDHLLSRVQSYMSLIARFSLNVRLHLATSSQKRSYLWETNYDVEKPKSTWETFSHINILLTDVWLRQLSFALYSHLSGSSILLHTTNCPTVSTTKFNALFPTTPVSLKM